MRPSFRLLFLIPALAPVQVFAKEAVKEFTLYHRAFHPTAPLIQYSKRGQLILDPINQPSFRSSPTFAKDLLSFGQTLRDSGVNLDAAFYQIALERENDVSEAHWDISVVKICHLRDASAETIILHTNDPHGIRPYALDYFVSPVPHDGACPKPKTAKSSNLNLTPLHVFAENVDKLNSTIIIRTSHVPPLPELKAPPPLNPQGQVEPPVPEKTFLQKYWVYIVVGLIALMLSGGGDEEEPKRRAQ